MSGTTLCPHCDTRFKIAEPQLEAHHGMVRCGSCLKAFDARPSFVPDQPSPQLELPIPDESGSAEETDLKEAIQTAGEADAAETVPPEAPGTEIQSTEAQSAEAQSAEVTHLETLPPETPHGETPDSSQPGTAHAEQDGDASPTGRQPSKVVVLHPRTLAEQVVIVRDENISEPKPEYRRWPWVVASVLLVLLMFAQAVYFFRSDLAARLPGLKPALMVYCRVLRCSVPLQQRTDLMGIESSDLETEPEHENQITLNALLRNRASYPQAFPNLELTLNDTQDKPVARRIFKPKDYLPPQESEQTGLLPDHELIVKLYLNTADLRPTGYRLVLFYPRQ
ncbi:MAG: zinc-ribbon domain-containing protein [Nitrosomonadales bacterium]|nr:zinc-ribbon domain-containing protein [Nitrosomonadales bacterium]